ncbi:unnamed protein product [Owenia fusiformis]|uniref:Uncharacterized protein n=1 Tax=Owenia fusiformis TaxID=6347 RepID=A0A8J1TZ08_OWEFU|nr:unnamed protein product [Owenia fusiformis]
MATHFELIELARHLKQERLFVSSEKEQLQSLNEQVAKTAQTLYHVSWIGRQQRQNLDQLILNSREVSPATCCHNANMLELSNFVDAYKHLSYHESKYGEFLKQFRENPRMIAACLVQGEQLDVTTMQNIVHIVVTSLYANGVMPEDENYLLQVLKSLIEFQLAKSSNPRRMLRKGSCAFSRVFKLLNEGQFSAKLFLTAALHNPVMRLLMEDEWFYDIDPDKALVRFPQAERIRRFGQPGTVSYTENLNKYRQFTNEKLVQMTNRFILSIKNNLYCFPQSLCWLVSQLYHMINKSNNVDTAEARAMCADLVFTLFICPAICDPEPYGITSDTPLSYIARHNLMQVAQILQVLAISKWDEIDPKLRDLYSRFEQGCMSSLLDSMLECSVSDMPPQASTQLYGLERSAMLMTPSNLQTLMTFLSQVQQSFEPEEENRKTLEDLLSGVPPPSALQVSQTNTPCGTPPGTPGERTRKQHKSLKKKLSLAPPAIGSGGLDDSTAGDTSLIDGTSVDSFNMNQEDVIVITLDQNTECPGMLSEEKVLSMDNEMRPRRVKYSYSEDGGGEIQEKRTRFSLSHDQDSIATSDNLEATSCISDAASSHSAIGSDGEDNENMSDMTSANVSGRGSPSLSGRGTPLSQVGDAELENVEQRRPGPDLPVMVQKTNREDVTERFGKFDIKQELERDDVRSTVSDAWSTDVMASDSEPPEMNQLERLEEVAEEVLRSNLLGVQEVSEVSETASDAWSTDVLAASDTDEKQAERLREVDQQDDTENILPELQEEVFEENGSTPLASGVQSPEDSQKPTDETTAPVDPTPPLDRHFDPFAKSSPKSSKERQSEPNQVTFRHGDLENRPRAVSDIVGVFRKIDDHKYDHTSSQRVSASFKHAEGRVVSVLEQFDPFQHEALSKEGGAIPKKRAGQYSKNNSNSQNRGDNAQGLNNQIISPDQGISSPGFEDEVELRRNTERDSGVAETPEDQNPELINILSENMEQNLKLTEQQNLKIDNRLSTSSILDSFDPINNASFDQRGSRSLSEPVIPEFKRPNSLQSGVARELGLPPPGASTEVTPTNISVQIQEGLVEGPLTSSTDDTEVEVDLNDADTELVTMETAEIDMRDSGLGSFSKPAEFDPLGAVTQAGQGLIKLRSDTESSSGSGRSSEIEVSQEVVPSKVDSRLTRSDDHVIRKEKEFSDSDNGAAIPQGEQKKKSSSIFKAFKDKLKGTGSKKRTSNNRDDKEDMVPNGSVHVDPTCLGEKHSSLPSMHGAVDILDGTRNLNGTRPASSEQINNSLSQESSDDILAKYRKKPLAVIPPVTVKDSVPNIDKVKLNVKEESEEEGPPAYDPINLENCQAFQDAKRKLRMVLSTADIQTLPSQNGLIAGYYSPSIKSNDRKENDLVAFLKVQLAEAINLQDKDLVAQLHETLRCLRQFDNIGIKKLLKSMQEDYKNRSAYVAYLIRSRQGLLTTVGHLERLLHRIQRDKEVCNTHFISVCVRLFLDSKEKSLMKFMSDFTGLTVSDEKTDLVERFLDYLSRQMESDALWQAANEGQIEDAHLAIERLIMSRIYTHAMFPNGDGDQLRDQVLRDHIQKLADVISPNHKDLRIAKMYHYECPWPAAQAEIDMINAYKTPKDKLRCVLRCSSTIMNLLSMANPKSVPAADDFMPVLIYVLIKANPPSLLSTVQYVNSFYEKRLAGEEQYWWMQFTSAIEFIKTMDYTS